ncbi:BRO family protein [Lactococcus lactis]|uniref:BRO family protein n=1 Tax=Lactococcus lactis TaxID=1358 RepID=UPI002418486E|nr:BRO family protein [Lactococcus lactis]MDG4966326.1 BRO family protein [Lactococcus lactis]
MNTTTIRTVEMNGTTYYAITDIFKETDFDITDYQIKNIVSKGNVTKQSIGSANKNLLINLAGLKQIVKRSKSEKLPNLKKFIAEIDTSVKNISELNVKKVDSHLDLNSFYQFIFQGKNIRMITLDNRPYFLGTDVAEALGYEKLSNAINQNIKEKWRLTLTWRNYPDLRQLLWNGNDKTNKIVISEAGLNKLIFGSQLPQAEDMQDLVYSEVLPQIRTTGSYSLSDTPQSDITAQEVHLLKLKEKAFDKAVEKIAFENSCYTMTQAAEQLGMSVRQFTSLLKDNGLIYYDYNAKIMATDPNSKLFYLRKFHESKNSAIVQTKVTPFGLENFRLMFVSDSLNLLDLLEA